MTQCMSASSSNSVVGLRKKPDRYREKDLNMWSTDVKYNKTAIFGQK